MQILKTDSTRMAIIRIGNTNSFTLSSNKNKFNRLSSNFFQEFLDKKIHTTNEGFKKSHSVTIRSERVNGRYKFKVSDLITETKSSLSPDYNTADYFHYGQQERYNFYPKPINIETPVLKSLKKLTFARDLLAESTISNWGSTIRESYPNLTFQDGSNTQQIFKIKTFNSDNNHFSLEYLNNPAVQGQADIVEIDGNGFKNLYIKFKKTVGGIDKEPALKILSTDLKNNPREVSVTYGNRSVRLKVNQSNYKKEWWKELKISTYS